MLASALLTLALAAVVVAQDSNVTVVQATLQEDGVIPDVLPANFTPRFPFEVRPMQENVIVLFSNIM
jgi:hypothetical protein